MTTTQTHDVAHLRARVRLYVQVILAIDLLAYLSDAAKVVFMGETVPVLLIRGVVTTVLVTAWALSKWARLPRAAIIALEGAVTLVLSVSYVYTVEDYLGDALPPEANALFVALGIVLLLVVRSAVIPSSVLRTALVGLGAFAIQIAMSRGHLGGAEPLMVEGLVFMGVAFVIATAVTSRVIYGLRVQVRRALRLGQYEVGDKLGEGGMGAVYRARHAMLRRDAAIKLIRPELAGGDAETRSRTFSRFEREAQVTARLESPHTVRLYDFGVSPDGAFYYVMELLDGVDLRSLVERYGPLRPERAVHVLRQICDSLEEAHRAGLVHRDVKPANVLICRAGIRHDVAKVLDFGLVARDRDAAEGISADLTADGTIAGTPAFIAPEMATGGPIDGRADLYALGCVAYWLLTGQLVFARPTPMATVIAHATEAPIPPSELSELPIPPALEAVVMRCLAKAPADRPQSALALADALADAVTGPAWREDDARAWWDAHAPTARRTPSPRREDEPAWLTAGPAGG